MGKRPVNRFFEKYMEIAANNPEKLLYECYEMAEKWHKWKFGKRRYKNLNTFKSIYSQQLNKKK